MLEEIANRAKKAHCEYIEKRKKCTGDLEVCNLLDGISTRYNVKKDLVVTGWYW